MIVTRVRVQSLTDLVMIGMDHVFKYRDTYFSTVVAATFMVVYYTYTSMEIKKFIKIIDNKIQTYNTHHPGSIPVIIVVDIKTLESAKDMLPTRENQ